jgi:hypothetical protein
VVAGIVDAGLSEGAFHPGSSIPATDLLQHLALDSATGIFKTRCGTINNKNLNWGAGQKVCPGNFFPFSDEQCQG